MDLRRRGVSADTIDAALEEVLDDGETLDAARELAGKRWARLQGESDPRKRQKKLHDHLLRRGFSYDVIRTVLDELLRR